MVPESATVTDDLEERLRSAAREVDATCVCCSGPGLAVTRAPEPTWMLPWSLPRCQRHSDGCRSSGGSRRAVGAAAADVVFLHAGTDPVLRSEIIRSGRVLHEPRPRIMVQERVAP
jgi:hypothetical protein